MIIAGAAAATQLLRLLPEMRSDFESSGAFRTSTATLMWSTYGAAAASFALALRAAGRPPWDTPTVVGGAAAVAGSGLVAAGMGAFSSAGQVAGTDTGQLTTDGVYRISRNPQYAGAILAMAGLATAFRSGPALALAAAVAGVYRWWVPVEEAALTKTFGGTYTAYRKTAPRWLGSPAG